MRVPVSQKRIRAKGTRVQPLTGNVFSGIAQGLGAISDAMFRAESKRAAQADLSYVNGKMSQTVEAFLFTRDKFRNLYGNDSVQYVEEYGAFTRNFIDQIALDAPTLKTKNQLFIQLNTLQLSELKSANAERDKAFKDNNKVLFEKDIEVIRTSIRNNWREWQPFFNNGISLYANARESFLEQTEYEQGVVNFTSDISKDVVIGWFREQGNKLRLIKEIREGKLKSPEIQLLYDQLTFEERENLSEKLLKEYLSLIKASNVVSKDDDESGKNSFNESVLKFYLADSDNDALRQRIFDKIKLSKYMNPERLIKLQNILDGFDSADVPSVVFNVRYQIETGKLTRFDQLLDYIGEGLSFDTARTEMLSLIGASGDSRFKNAKRILSRALGLPEGLIVFDPNEPRREEQFALEELERFYASNPTGNFVEAANNILAKREEKLRVERLENIRRRKDKLEILTNEYESNPSDNLAEEIATINRAIKRLENK
ncbi:MAG: hypothetical protein QQN44_06190 [Nitrosopumilus sp.]